MAVTYGLMVLAVVSVVASTATAGRDVEGSYGDAAYSGPAHPLPLARRPPPLQPYNFPDPPPQQPYTNPDPAQQVPWLPLAGHGPRPPPQQPYIPDPDQQLPWLPLARHGPRPSRLPPPQQPHTIRYSPTHPPRHGPYTPITHPHRHAPFNL